jgi:ribosomal protein L3
MKRWIQEGMPATHSHRRRTWDSMDSAQARNRILETGRFRQRGKYKSHLIQVLVIACEVLFSRTRPDVKCWVVCGFILWGDEGVMQNRWE